MVAEVIVDILNSAVDKIFDYLIPEGLNLDVGYRVLVPFGNRSLEGYIIKIKSTSNLDSSKLKCIIKGLDDFACLSEETLELANFMTQNYNVTKASSLRLFLPSSLKKVKEKYVKIASLNIDNLSLVKNETQNKIVEYLKNKQELLSELNSKFSPSSIKTLIKNEVIKIDTIKENRVPYKNKLMFENKKITLNDEQQNALNLILNNSPNNFLIHGVTASGKTEVYLQVIENALKNNKTAILLVPEIALTPQLFKRFKERLGDNVAILHSGLSNGERLDEWLKIKRGEARVVIGARSAIFAPVENLGAVIIDEEHDTSYFSETNPRYYTHEVAKFRTSYNNCSLILGSATPCAETYFKAKNGDYILIELKTRALKQKMPEIKIVDMCSEIRNGNSSCFSNVLLSKLSETINKNEQALIFINRRGYSSFIRCLDCGYIPECEDCDVSLFYHKEDNQLKCHYCGNRYKVITKCPVCNSTNIRLGAIGTERIKEELSKYFPNTKIFRLDNDITANKNKTLEIINEFNATAPAILVGTQMISKGHNFNKVSLVGVIDADLSLHFSDFRASDRTFDLLTQVAGRAGRSDTEGYVVLQTYTPKHFVYNCVSSYNYKAFYEKEINLRKVTKFPPYSEIVRILVTSEYDNEARTTLLNMYNEIMQLRVNNPDDFIYLSGVKCPLKRIKKQHRYQILMRLNLEHKNQILQEIFKINNKFKNKNVISFVEINPQNLS